MTLALWLGGGLIAAAVLLSLLRAPQNDRPLKLRKQVPSFSRHFQQPKAAHVRVQPGDLVEARHLMRSQ